MMWARVEDEHDVNNRAHKQLRIANLLKKHKGLTWNMKYKIQKMNKQKWSPLNRQLHEFQ